MALATGGPTKGRGTGRLATAAVIGLPRWRTSNGLTRMR